MKRKIIHIDEDLCNGCGDCVVACEEGALKIVNGKAKLVRDDFCDGFGNCIGPCPTGALKIIEREADPFDEKAVQESLAKKEEKEKTEIPHHHGGGCPGSRNFSFKKKKEEAPIQRASQESPQQLGHMLPSELGQWPVQLHLVNPMAPFLNGKELVILSTCSPVASADIHWRYLRGRNVLVACPKLDRTDPYIPKLAAIFQANELPKVIVVRMEVPCCGGLTYLISEAIKLSGKDILFEEHVISVQGDLKEVRKV